MIVNFNNDTDVELEVVESIPVDVSCGQFENGWFCIGENGAEYFVSESGIVYTEGRDEREGLSTAVGTAPEIKERSDRMERQMDESLNDHA
jgi:hypothetical protein